MPQGYEGMQQEGAADRSLLWRASQGGACFRAMQGGSGWARRILQDYAGRQREGAVDPPDAAGGRGGPFRVNARRKQGGAADPSGLTADALGRARRIFQDFPGRLGEGVAHPSGQCGRPEGRRSQVTIEQLRGSTLDLLRSVLLSGSFYFALDSL